MDSGVRRRGRLRFGPKERGKIALVTIRASPLSHDIAHPTAPFSPSFIAAICSYVSPYRAYSNSARSFHNRSLGRYEDKHMCSNGTHRRTRQRRSGLGFVITHHIRLDFDERLYE
jgi:hypothetical protein